MVRVPKKCAAWRVGLFEYFKRRLENERNARRGTDHILRTGVITELTQGFCHPRDGLILPPIDQFWTLVPVRTCHLSMPVDEPLGRANLRLRSFGGSLHALGSSYRDRNLQAPWSARAASSIA